MTAGSIVPHSALPHMLLYSHLARGHGEREKGEGVEEQLQFTVLGKGTWFKESFFVT